MREVVGDAVVAQVTVCEIAVPDRARIVQVDPGLVAAHIPEHDAGRIGRRVEERHADQVGRLELGGHRR